MVISRVILRVSRLRVLITLLITPLTTSPGPPSSVYIPKAPGHSPWCGGFRSQGIGCLGLSAFLRPRFFGSWV